jgi:hypothetical protein
VALVATSHVLWISFAPVNELLTRYLDLLSEP